MSLACLLGLTLWPGASEAAGRRAPDLLVTSFEWPPSFRSPGARLELTATVRNVGAVRTGASTTRFYLSPDRRRGGGDMGLSGQARTAALAPGSRSVGNARLRIPPRTRPGLYWLLACADDARKVREGNERNNCRAAPGRILVDRPRRRARPLNVSPQVDSARTASATIGPSGGRLSATGADGTVFGLTVPAGALDEAKTITMAPLLSIAGMRMSGGLVSGVQLGPDGVRLLRTATLLIKPSRKVPLTAQDGFGYSGTGQALHLYPLEPSRARIALPILHFSGYGIGDATAADRAALREWIPVAGEGDIEVGAGELIDQLRTRQISVPDLQDAMAHVLIKSFYREVIPAFKQALGANGDYHDGERAAHTLVTWQRTWELMLPHDLYDPHLRIAYKDMKEQGWAELAKVVRRFFDLAYDRCVAGNDVPFQSQRMTALARFASLGLDPHEALGADWEQRLERCREKLVAVWTGTINISWRHDRPPNEYTHESYELNEGRLDLSFEKRSPGTWRLSDGSWAATRLSYSRSRTNDCENIVSRHEATGSGSLAGNLHVALTRNAHPNSALRPGEPVYLKWPDLRAPATSGQRSFESCSYSETQQPGEASLYHSGPPFMRCGAGHEDPWRGWIPGTYHRAPNGSEAIEFNCTRTEELGGGVIERVEMRGTIRRTG